MSGDNKMNTYSQQNAQEYLFKVKLMLARSYPELVSVVSSDAVQSALDEQKSIEVISLRVLGELSRKVWGLYGEHLLKHDNSCTRELGHPAFDVLCLLARNGSEYVKVSYWDHIASKLIVELSGTCQGIPDHRYVLEFNRPFSDHLGSRVERSSDLGCIFPGKNDRNKGNTLLERVAILERRLPR